MVSQRARERAPRRFLHVPFAHEPRREAGSVLSTIRGWFGQRAAEADADVSALHVVRRDFPFASAAGPVFFSRREEDLRRFRAAHGQRLVYGRGPLRGTLTTVVGARGGRLFVYDDHDNLDFATPLDGADAATLARRYRFSVADDAGAVLEPAALPELTDEERWFLQTAPDITAAIEGGPDGNANGEDGACAGSGAAVLSPVVVPQGPDGSGPRMLGWTGERSVRVRGAGLPSCGQRASMVVSLLVPPSVSGEKNQ